MNLLNRFSLKKLGCDARWRAKKLLSDSITIKTKQGVFTVKTSDDTIGKELFCRGEYELATIRQVFDTLTRHNLLPGSGEGTLLDVGANCGVISVGVLTQGLMKTAIAIEPEPVNFSLLVKNVQNNHFENRITPLQFAISSTSGKVTFELNNSNLGDHRVRTPGLNPSVPEFYGESQRSVIEIESRRLDEALKDLPEATTRNISLVWMDIQGYEGHALKGAEALLSKSIPLMSELWPYGILRSGFSRADYCAVVKQYWKHVWVCRNDQFVRHPIDFIEAYWNEVGEGGLYQSVIFTS